jgi:protein-disulfide isomerase
MAAAARVTPPNDSKKKSAAAPSSGPGAFYALVGALVVLGAGVLIYLARRPKDLSIPAKVTVMAADTAGFRGYLLGSESAPVEITEYADYQCPACQSFEMLQFDVVKRQLIDSGVVRWRYRDFPLDQLHRHARLSAHAAACGDEQGKYWPLHRIIYENQPAWERAASAGSLFSDYAKQAGLDPERYDACMKSTKYAGRIEASLQEGIKVGVNSTPTFLIGGRLYPGVKSSDSLAAIAKRLAAQPAK